MATTDKVMIYGTGDVAVNRADKETAFPHVAAALAEPDILFAQLETNFSLKGSQFPTGHGSHATPSEIAVTQWGYPDAIKSANYAPQIAPTGPIREAMDFRARYPDGRMGSDPGQATPEKGGELVAAAVAGLIEDVAAFSAEVAPV